MKSYFKKVGGKRRCVKIVDVKYLENQSNINATVKMKNAAATQLLSSTQFHRLRRIAVVYRWRG